MADMKALQVTRHGPPGEVLAVRTVERPEPGPERGTGARWARRPSTSTTSTAAGETWSRCPHPRRSRSAWTCAAWSTPPERAPSSWLGERVVAITKNALGRHRRVRHRRRHLGLRGPRPASTTPRRPRSCSRSRPRTSRCSAGARLQAGETLVVHSAASGLGTAGIQLGKAAGARVIAVAGGPEKVALCTSLGADLVVDHTAEDFVEAVLAATGRRRSRRRLRPDRRRLRRALVALHRPRGSLPGGGLRRRRRQRHDRPAAADGLHREHRHRGRDAGLGRLGRPRHAPFRLQPLRARRRRRDPRRPPAPGRRRGRSDPSWAGGSPWRRRAAPSTSTRRVGPWVAPWSRSLRAAAGRAPRDERRGVHLARRRVAQPAAPGPQLGGGTIRTASASNCRR